MTQSRRHLFALLGLVLPIAAFTASPVSAASSLDQKPHKTHANASHKAKPKHATTHRTSHRSKHQPAPKVSAS